MTRILAVDPGAERLGWAVIDCPYDEFKPKVHDSGILGIHREPKEEYQPYKMRLIDYWAHKGAWLFYTYRPLVFVSETQPAVGGGSFIAATQSELAKTAVTILQAQAFERGLKVIQVAANSVKAYVAGKKDATKAKVRNGVIEKLGDEAIATLLKSETTGQKPVWDRSDALAAGVTYLGKMR